MIVKIDAFATQDVTATCIVSEIDRCIVYSGVGSIGIVVSVNNSRYVKDPGSSATHCVIHFD